MIPQNHPLDFLKTHNFHGVDRFKFTRSGLLLGTDRAYISARSTDKARSAKDDGKVERLSKQADDLGKTFGPEFIRLNAGLEDVDLQSKEGKGLTMQRFLH